MIEIVEARTRAQLNAARELFAEYAGSLEIDLCFQGFREELAALPGRYAAPRGRLLLAVSGSIAVACIALRPMAQNTCELKRLYVRPAFRGRGLGRRLTEAALAAARAVGYRRMRLDTLSSMPAAIALYESLGFRRVPPYYHNPSELAVFLELALQAKISRQPAATHYHAAMSKAVTRLAPPTTPVPPRWRQEVASILITEAMLAARIAALGRQIERDFAGREMVVVSLLNGTVMFIGDLIRHLSHPLRLDFMGVSSYGKGTESGELVFTKELRLDVRGRHVLLVDDILDTGRTLSRVTEILRALKPRSLKICVLLDKPERRVEQVKVDYVGFEIPDQFVIGYGLDYAEKYRNLPFVGVLKPEMYATKPAKSSAQRARKK